MVNVSSLLEMLSHLFVFLRFLSFHISHVYFSGSLDFHFEIDSSQYIIKLKLEPKIAYSRAKTKQICYKQNVRIIIKII